MIHYPINRRTVGLAGTSKRFMAAFVTNKEAKIIFSAYELLADKKFFLLKTSYLKFIISKIQKLLRFPSGGLYLELDLCLGLNF